jgi:hypothetical protein
MFFMNLLYDSRNLIVLFPEKFIMPFIDAFRGRGINKENGIKVKNQKGYTCTPMETPNIP